MIDFKCLETIKLKNISTLGGFPFPHLWESSQKVYVRCNKICNCDSVSWSPLSQKVQHQIQEFWVPSPSFAVCWWCKVSSVLRGRFATHNREILKCLYCFLAWWRQKWCSHLNSTLSTSISPESGLLNVKQVFISVFSCFTKLTKVGGQPILPRILHKAS